MISEPGLGAASPGGCLARPRATGPQDAPALAHHRGGPRFECLHVEVEPGHLLGDPGVPASSPVLHERHRVRRVGRLDEVTGAHAADRRPPTAARWCASGRPSGDGLRSDTATRNPAGGSPLVASAGSSASTARAAAASALVRAIGPAAGQTEPVLGQAAG